MKKVFVFVVCALLCAGICFPVFADMGGPEMIGYDVVAPVDVDYFDWKWDEDADRSYFEKGGVIPAGTKLHISNEQTQDGVEYGYFFDAQIGGKNVDAYVRLDDLNAPQRAPYPASKGVKQKVKVRLRVTEPAGLVLRSGPSATYPVVTTIPQGTDLTCDTLDNNGYELGAWMYLTYGGKGGWAHCWLYDGDQCPVAELLPDGVSGTVLVVKNKAALKDKDDNTLVIVPKGTVLPVEAFNRTAHAIFYHVTYEGKSGIFIADDDGWSDNYIAFSLSNWGPHELNFTKDATEKLYANPDDKIPAGRISFKEGDSVRWQYKYYADPLPQYRGGVEWFYVEKDGKEGWISPDFESIAAGTGEEKTDIPLLYSWAYDEDGEGSDETVTEAVQADAVVPETTAEEESTAEEETTDAPSTESGSSEPQTETTDASRDSAPPTTTPSRSPAAIIGICIAAAAILALTAFVTLKLIRRKKG